MGHHRYLKHDAEGREGRAYLDPLPPVFQHQIIRSPVRLARV